MAIENIDKQINNIYDEVKDKKLVLPRFQRGFVWNRDKQTNLISSFLVNLPFGSLLYLNGNKGDFITRQLCFSNIIEDANSNVDYILDGQQRLSTLRSVIYDIFQEEGINNWEETWSKLYSSLRNRWFIRLKPESEEEDIFGYFELTHTDLTQKTDADVKEFIEYKTINKTKDTDQPFHPNFDLSLTKMNSLERVKSKRNRIKYFSDLGIVPLYEIYLGEKGIHKEVINAIAQERVEVLKGVLKEDISPETIYKSFSMHSNIIESKEAAEELYTENEGDQDKLIEIINEFWAEIKANWVQKLEFNFSQLLYRKLPIIKLDKSETNRAIAIFESINKGGINLSVFDLTVAKAASQQGSDLVSLIAEKLGKTIDVSKIGSSFPHKDWSPKYMQLIDGDEPTKQFKEWFVNVLSLYICSYINKIPLNGPSAIKREAILSLDSELINNNASNATTGIIRALAFLNTRCGIINSQDIAFKLIVVVLAYFLCDDKVWDNNEKLNRLEYWYWISAFSGEYTYRQNERCIEDIKSLTTFLNNGKQDPFYHKRENMLNFKGCNESILLRKKVDITNEIESNSIKNIMLQYILSTRPWDFVSNKSRRLNTWEISKKEYSVEIHHIAPLTGATKIEQSTKEIRKDPKHILNSMLNMTYISKDANQAIKDRPAHDYLNLLEQHKTSSHFVTIDKDTAISANDDRVSFLENRFKLLTNNINKTLDSLT